MKLRELAVSAGAAVLMFACSARDEDVRPDAAAAGADSVADSVTPVAGTPDTLSPSKPDTSKPPPQRTAPDSSRRDSNVAAPPGRNPPIGDPAPIPRPPVRLPRGDST